ncbi:MAG: ATP-dependent DNA helicase RecG [Anaerolineales bacterium]
MKLSLEKLHKFFKLEAERGYDNRAVVGGLGEMLGRWEAEARAEGISDTLITVVVSRLNDYHRLSPTSRAEALEGLWTRIQRDTSQDLPPLPTAPREKRDQPAKPATPPASTTNALPTAVESGKPPIVEEHKEKPDETTADQDAAVATPEMPEKQISPQEQAGPEGTPAALNASTTVLPGVGSRHAQTLKRLGLSTLADMLYYFPRRYDDYSQLIPIHRLKYGQEVTVIGTIQSVSSRPIRGGKMEIVEAIVSDGSGPLRATWFNQPWIAKRLHKGMAIVLSGKVEQYLGRLVMNNPESEALEQHNLNTNRIVPVYPLTANITQKWLRRLMYQVVTYWAPRVSDHLPEHLRRSAGLLDLPKALFEAHFPTSFENLKAARHRLAFDEIFFLQMGVLRQKRSWQNRTAQVFETSDDWLAGKVNLLPFQLTTAQQQALQDVRADLAAGQPMNRLLQGDVGSGKTVIAGLAIAMLAQHGAQAALMAPTSILAEQHYKSLLSLLANTGENTGDGVTRVLQPEQIRLMIGSTPEPEKRIIRDGLSQGDIKLVIGTHALIEDPIVFKDLQLVIVDEQHRFGVEQRASLRSKGHNPHLLVMTATPIPRSLALTVYGDLDLTVIDEMPPGRQTVDTHVLFPRERERAYSLIRSQLEQGRQAFIIYPLVEESENSETPAAVQEYQRLQKEIFPEHKLGLLHGRMKAEEKDEIMSQFRDRLLHILVSTSVVEVGVDIPNASVMLIEGANRFGLSQLHQFRGRVGRGTDKSYCLLIPETPDAVENERLQAMAETNDGFVLAERDLEQRGPGDFLGTRQSGYAELRMAKLTDVHLIENARKHSQMIFAEDADLKNPENALLASALHRFWGDAQGDIS